MVLILESCSLEESCSSLGGSPKLLLELRDRLREWLNLQPHLPKDISDNGLDHFILGTKMSLEQSKHKLDMFFTMRQYAPEVYMNRDPQDPSFARLRKIMQIVYLPKLTPEKYSVSIIRPITEDYRKFDAADSFKYLYMLGFIHAHETHSLGAVVVIDCSKATLRYITSFTPTLVKKCEIIATEVCATRIKGIHCINGSQITSQLFTVVKSILKPKIAQRVHAHLPGSYESLYKFIPKSILPKDYGGDEIPMNELSEEWRQKSNEWRNKFLDDDKNVVDERLRPGPVMNSEKLFGISGSFRKLDVD